MSDYTERYGKLALVTGASTGIGKEFAKQLAARGMDVIITARSLDKLEALATEIRNAHKVEVTVVRSDLGSVKGVEAFIDATSELEVDVLINNAGAATPGAFLGSDIERQHASLVLNVEAPLRLTHHFARGMARRKRGGVLFVSSTIGYGTAPWMAHYAGTKNFLTSFAEGLRGELAINNVDVAVLSPGPTKTPMVEFDGMDMSKLPMIWMTAEAVAAQGLAALPRRKSKIAGKMNTVMTFFMSRFLPRAWSAKMFGSMMGDVMVDELKDQKLLAARVSKAA